MSDSREKASPLPPEALEHYASGCESQRLHYFTTTFFHTPEELESEMKESGFQYEHTLAIEGPLWLLPYAIANFQNQEKRAQLLAFVQQIEQEPSLLGASGHLMAVAYKERKR